MLCVECGEMTKKVGRKYCSTKCSNSSKFKKDLTKQSLKEKYGDENYVNVEKMKETNLKKYGVSCTIHSRESIKNISILRKTQRKDRLLEKIKEQKLEIIDVSQKEIFKFKCVDCQNEFDINYQTFYLRNISKVKICPICNPSNNYSNMEKEILDFIKSRYSDKIEENSRDIISPLELDIYLPELKLAFEFNGLYWHSELNKDKNYHLNKTEECEKQGIHLVHIYEDDWVFKQNIVKSRILNLLGKSEKIFARKCIIKEVPFNKSKEFLDNNHLQGGCSDKIRLGLFTKNNDTLVALITFGKLRRNLGQKNITDDDFELIRFCNKLNNTVIGGANKLFNHFTKVFNPKTIISYADRSWTMNNGNALYDTLGFTNKGTSAPNYHYIVDCRRKNRFNYRKNVLIEQGFDANKTEHQIMLDREIYRIFNSGQMKYFYVNHNFQKSENSLSELFK